MTDLALKKKQFKGISDKEAHRLIQRATSIINKCASFGVVVSCSIRELEPLLPKWIHGFEGTYPVCCHMAMTTLGDLVGEAEEIAYFFESGHRHQAQAHGFMSRVLVLLRHRIGGAWVVLRGALQHGHRARVVARATIRCRRIVAIELATCRSGRTGGASGWTILGNLRRRELIGGVAGG